MPVTAPYLQAAPVLPPVGSGVSFIWGFCLEKAGSRGRLCRAWLTWEYHWDVPGGSWQFVRAGTLWRWLGPQFGKPLPSRDSYTSSADPGMYQPFLGHSWCPLKDGNKVLHFPALKSCAQWFFLWLTTAISICQESPRAISKSSPGLSQMMCRTEVWCSVLCQSPVTWRGDAWPMPEPAAGPWETMGNICICSKRNYVWLGFSTLYWAVIG